MKIDWAGLKKVRLHWFGVKREFWGVLLAVVFMGAIWAWFLWREPHTRGPQFLYTEQIARTYQGIVPLAVVGGGPAGYSAGLYGARGKIHTVLFEGAQPGGQLMGTSYVENWPGIPKRLGSEIMKGLREQAVSCGVHMVPESINSINTRKWPYELITHDGKTVFALTVIIATGASPKTLEVPGLKEYWGGKGVTTCAICDAPFYKDKDVIVVGGGDAAVEEALQLAPYARHVTVCVRKDKMRATPVMAERLKDFSHITTSFRTNVVEIRGDGEHVREVVLDQNGQQKHLPMDGVFLAIGHQPNTSFVNSSIERDKDGYIRLFPASGAQATSVPGIFAAGDVSDRRYQQAGVAAGDGIKAALDALNFLRHIGYRDVAGAQLYVPVQHVRSPLINLKNETDFVEHIDDDEQRLVVLDFYTPFCPSCKQMMPIIETTLSEFKDRVIGYKIDAVEAKDLAKRFVVGRVPLLVLLKKGKEIARLTDSMSQQDFTSLIRGFVNRE